MIEIGLVRESNPIEGRADTCPVVSVWLVGWLILLKDCSRIRMLIGSSAPSAAHLAQGMSQLL